MLEFEYSRAAYKNGLKLAEELGTNPYKFGLVGSSDAHTGLAAMEEDNFFGKTTPQEPSPERMLATFVDNKETGVKIMDWEVGASGYAAVWATENTRESIWDAMQRKETYATTGPRMIVRFFGGWNFAPSDAEDRLPAHTGYSKGVPMGGDLGPAPEGKARPSCWPRSRIRLAPISTAIRSSRAGSMRTASCTRRSTMWFGPATANRAKTARCLRSATPWTWRTRPGPTRSARQS